MQFIHDFDRKAALPVGWDVRVLLLQQGGPGNLPSRLASLGVGVVVEAEPATAVAALAADPPGFGLLVVDCDSLAAPAGHGPVEDRALPRLLAASGAKVPVILISRDHLQQCFPQARDQPVRLRAPLSAVSLRVGFEHAMRGRLMRLTA